MSETVYVVDTFASLFRWYHAHREALTNSRGEPTHAVRGMVLDIQHLLRKCKPSHLIYAMESEGRGQRGEIDPNYKANRGEMPDDLRSQIPKLLAVLDAFQIPTVSFENWEADDVIATLTRQAVEQGYSVRIVTNDKDARQLLRDEHPSVEIYSIRKQEPFNVQHLWDEWGIRPDQVIDFQSLVGDSVDNVPGVPLVGPKKAQALLEELDTLDAVLANPYKAKGKKLQENLREFADQARMSRELVTLRQDLEIDFDWSTATISDPNVDALLALYEDYDFKSFADELRTGGGSSVSVVSTPASAKATPAFDGQGTLFGDPPDKERSWKTVDTQDEFDKLVKTLGKQKRVCIDLETTGTDSMRCQIVGWAIAYEAGSAYYIPVRGPLGADVLDHQMVVDQLKPILENPAVRVDNQNIKYDFVVMARAGIRIANIGLDPMVGDYLLDAGARSHGFDELSRRYLGLETISIKELIGTGKKQICFDEVPIEAASEYATEDADYSLRLADLIESKLKAEGLDGLYNDLERPLIRVLAEMEMTGFRINAEELERQSFDSDAEIEALTHSIYAAAGCEFNTASPKQLAKILFEDLGLPVQKRTKTGPSTDAEVLEKLADIHPLPRLIVEQRELAKLKGTYLDALPKMVHPKTGRIHASFNQTVAATGRLSTSEPNLQNIPVRTERGRMVRKAFIPGEAGWKLLCADYSQIELRFLAHFCKDPALVEAFESGADIHAAVAADVFGLSLDEVTSDQRRVAKAVNFGVIYGQTAFGLSTALGIDREEAQAFIDAYFEQFSSVKAFIDQTLDDCLTKGYAETILGRRRPISGIRPPDKRRGPMNFPERTAFNAVIQGSAADLMKQAMLDVHKNLPADARMLLQVHDELVFETPANSVASLAEFVKETMRTAMEISVPLVVDVKVGENWLEAEGV